MIYGYARVSTKEQNLDTQIETLKGYGCEVIIEEKHTGTTFKRPQLDKLIKGFKAGDKLIITRVDRLGRNTIQLLQLVEQLKEMDVSLFIIELGIEATHRNGKLFLTILSALSVNERELLTEKRMAGLRNAQANGVIMGRRRKPKGLVDEAIKLWLQKEYTIREIEKATGVSNSILYREIAKRGLKRELV
ncbi:recombinase family protein [Paenisporosarcina macmurdoensis]|uniref:Recombinase family protein n=1 Tax=Paenisporosarcina macmurdoensis TaxID=212659 RepID=A0ABW1L857_9BACL